MDVNLTPEPIDVVKQPEQVAMTFPQAMEEIKKGKRVARLEWANQDYCILTNGWLQIFTKNKLYTWKINDGDVKGADWIVVLEK